MFIGKKKKRNIIIIGIIVVITAIGFFSREYLPYLFIPGVTENQLKNINLDKYKKLMIVAHPDDELIWGGGHLIEGDYFVVCITRGYDKVRRKEFETVIDATDDTGLILSYPDKIAGKRSDWKIWKKDIERDIQTIIDYKKWDLVVTHNAKGEYGHQHHIATHKLVNSAYGKTDSTANLMYFGKYYKRKDLPADLEQIDDELIQQKEELSKIYKSQKKTVNKLRHSFPYENWTKE